MRQFYLFQIIADVAPGVGVGLGQSTVDRVGAVIGLVGCGFYAGNVYGSVSAAHKDNRARSREFLDRLREVRVDALPTVDGDGAVVRVRLPF